MRLLFPFKTIIKHIVGGVILTIFLCLVPQKIFSQPNIKISINSDTLILNRGSVFTIKEPSVIVTIKVDFENSILWRYKIEGNTDVWSEWSLKHNIIASLKPESYILYIEQEGGKVFQSPFQIDRSFNFYWLILIFGIPLFLYFFYRISIRTIKDKLLRQINKQVRLELEKEFKLKLLTDPSSPGTIGKIPKSQLHKTYSKKYEQVSVLFADIQGFTKIVEHINPEALIDELDKYFFFFDEVVEKYGIEKIKTIGDAYMCAGGIPEKNRTNPVEVVLAALEMQIFMKKNSNISDIEDKFGIWELRIGIHTGPVISGMVGRKKIAFDIWGDTVNIASRMESSGKASEENITGVTFQFVRDFFVCQYRGKMPIKYKGETDMYFVKSIKPELSIDGKGVFPNENFFTKLQHIRLGDLEEFILGRLKTEIPENIVYHNADHTIDVMTRVEILARGENVSEKDLLLLKTAALLHDSGFLFHFDKHEENSILVAKEILPKYKYSQYQIDTIVQLIEVTKLDVEPSNLLEEIIKDADLDYLGRTDYILLSQNLFNELNSNGKKLSEADWTQQQYNFISNHRYYTNTAQKLRQVNKEKQLEKLKALSAV